MIDQYWSEVSLIKDAATETPIFSNLSNLARFVPPIPRSNSFCEGIFQYHFRRFSPTQDTTWSRMSLEGILILVYVKVKLVSETIFLAC